MKPVAYISDGGILFKESPLDSILKLSPLYTSAEIQALHNLVKEQQAEIEMLKKEIEDDEWTKDKLILKAKKTIMHDFNNFFIELQKNESLNTGLKKVGKK